MNKFLAYVIAYAVIILTMSVISPVIGFIGQILIAIILWGIILNIWDINEKKAIRYEK